MKSAIFLNRTCQLGNPHSVQITILLILRRTKELNFFIKMFYFICAILFSLAFAGYNNAEWYFGRTNRNDNIELAFYGIRLGLSWFMALMAWCPDLTVNIHECPDGRLFVPSESKSKLVRALHRFRYLWSYTWPKSLRKDFQNFKMRYEIHPNSTL